MGKDILDDRELLLAWLLWLLWLVSESFMSFISVMRQVVSCCLAAGEGRVVVVIVRDSELVILTGRQGKEGTGSAECEGQGVPQVRKCPSFQYSQQATGKGSTLLS